MKKNSGDRTRAQSEREIRKLNESLREQWARMDKAQKLADELHEEIKQVEAHVADGKKQTRRRK